MTLFLAHYYPNYIIENGKPSGWWMGGQSAYYSTQQSPRFNKFVDAPIIGFYDVRDKNVVAWQVNTAYRYGIDGFIVSLWTTDTTAWEYSALQGFLNSFESLVNDGYEAAKQFMLCIQVEAANQTATTVQDMVNWVYNNLASKDWYLLDPETGKPVLFIYSPGAKPSITNPGFTIYWFTAGADDDDYGYNLRSIGLDRTPMYASGIVSIAFRMPERPASMYNSSSPFTPIPFSIKRMERTLASLIMLQPKIVNLVSWNEWFETAIEPGMLYGYLWLEVLSKFIGRRW